MAEKVAVENEYVVRLLSDLLQTNRQILQTQVEAQKTIVEVVFALRELTESIQEIAYKMPYFE
tara:strand:- start:1126 stop:1314 length:189 start_codon:yes stop_codon:yes gene_type:complete